MTDYRLGVTGSRTWRNVTKLYSVLSTCKRLVPPDRTLVLVSGNCPEGADLYCEQWAGFNLVRAELHPADWDNCTSRCKPGHRKVKKPGDKAHPGELDDYCPGAGPRRNRQVLERGVDEVIGFQAYWNGRPTYGTSGYLEMAKAFTTKIATHYEYSEEMFV